MNAAMTHRIASLIPAPADMPDCELLDLADSLIGVAMRLTGIIHDEDPADAKALLEGLAPERLWALPFVMAAMIDVEQTASDLLAWAHVDIPDRYVGITSVAPSSVLLRSRPRPTKVQNDCGTVTAWRRHVAHREEPCDKDWVAYRAWEARKKQDQRDDARSAQQHPDRFTAVLHAIQQAREQLELFPATTPSAEEASDAA